MLSSQERQPRRTLARMPDNNQYTSGQNWAQALASGRQLLRELEPLLTTRRCGRFIARFREVSSTNAVAISWSANGAPDGALVLAEHQTAGRGRMGRVWEDDEGRNLMFTLILRPALRPDQLGLIMLATSVAVAESLTDILPGADVHIKWPNDVLVNGRKCCGMLMESSTVGARSERAEAAVIGVGLNVNQDGFPGSFGHRATSVALEAGRLIDRTPLLASVLNRFEQHYDELVADDGKSLRQRYERMLQSLGERVEVFAAGTAEPTTGVVRGISETGALLLETESGLRSVVSGEVSFRRGDAT